MGVTPRKALLGFIKQIIYLRVLCAHKAGRHTAIPGGPSNCVIMRFDNSFPRMLIGSKGTLLAPEAMIAPGIAGRHTTCGPVLNSH